MRSRLQRLTGLLLLVNAIADWQDLGAIWQIPIGIALFVSAVMLVAEDRTRSDSLVTLNLRG